MSDFAVTLAVPLFTAIISPLEDTFTTDVSSELHVILLSPSNIVLKLALSNRLSDEVKIISCSDN